MALFRRKTEDFIQTNSTGFGSNSNYSAGRFYNKDGTVNVKKRGIPLFDRISVYHSLLAMSPWKFFAVIIAFFVVVNLLFAGLYMLIGIEHLGGMSSNKGMEAFGEAFFFSAQTFTTVGYGRINPIGFVTSSVAAIEALLGLLSFALATGLLYGRFSRPKAYLSYSEHALIAPYKDDIAFMFRMAPHKNNHLTDAECTLTLAMQLMENGEMKNKFYFLPLELSKINSLALSWTIVHHITESSPLYGMTSEDLKKADAEFMIFVRAFDESFSNTVISRTSYTYNEVIFGARFRVMYHESDDNTTTILDLDRLNDYDRVPLPGLHNSEEDRSMEKNIYAQ